MTVTFVAGAVTADLTRHTKASPPEAASTRRGHSDIRPVMAGSHGKDDAKARVSMIIKRVILRDRRQSNVN